MLKFELNRLKRGRGSPQSQLMVNPKSSKKALARPSYAGVSLSDIRIPLMWKRKVRSTFGAPNLIKHLLLWSSYSDLVPRNIVLHL